MSSREHLRAFPVQRSLRASVTAAYCSGVISPRASRCRAVSCGLGAGRCRSHATPSTAPTTPTEPNKINIVMIMMNEPTPPMCQPYMVSLFSVRFGEQRDEVSCGQDTRRTEEGVDDDDRVGAAAVHHPGCVAHRGLRAS